MLQNVCFDKLSVFCLCNIVHTCHMFLYLYLPLLLFKNKQITKKSHQNLQIEEGQSIPCPKKDRRKDNVLPHSKRNLTKKPRMKSGTLEGKVVPAPLQAPIVLILNDTLIQVILNIMQCFCSDNT